MPVRDAGLLPDEKSIGVDAAGIGDIVDELMAPGRGFTMEQIVAISQGWRLGRRDQDDRAQGRRRRAGARRPAANDGLVRRQCARRAEGQRHPDHEAGIRHRQDRPADGRVQRGLADGAESGRPPENHFGKPRENN
jgi:hypothetical protein